MEFVSDVNTVKVGFSPFPPRPALFAFGFTRKASGPKLVRQANNLHLRKPTLPDYNHFMS